MALEKTLLKAQREYQAKHGGESPSNVTMERGKGITIRKAGRTARRRGKKGGK